MSETTPLDPSAFPPRPEPTTDEPPVTPSRPLPNVTPLQRHPSTSGPPRGVSVVEQSPTTDIARALEDFDARLARGGEVRRLPVVSAHGGHTGTFIEQFVSYPADEYQAMLETRRDFDHYLHNAGLHLLEEDNAHLATLFDREVTYGQALTDDLEALANRVEDGELSATDLARELLKLKQRREAPRVGGREGDHPPWLRSIEDLTADWESHTEQQTTGGYGRMLHSLLTSRRHDARIFIEELVTGRFPRDPVRKPNYKDINTSKLDTLRYKTAKSFRALEAKLAVLHERDKLYDTYADTVAEELAKDHPALRSRLRRVQ